MNEHTYRHGLGNAQPPVAWPTEKQRPGETLMEWSRRLDVQDNAALGSVKP